MSGDMVRGEGETFLELVIGMSLIYCDPKPVGEVLKRATFRLGGYGNAVFDGIKVTVWVKMRLFQQILHDVVVSYLSDYIMEVDVISDWGTFQLPSMVEQKAHKPAV